MSLRITINQNACKNTYCKYFPEIHFSILDALKLAIF